MSSSYSLVDILKLCFFCLTCCFALLWLPAVENDCNYEEAALPCIQVGAIISLVCLAKFFNSILFSVLITYTSEAFPAAFGPALNFGRMSIFVTPFFINFARSLAPFHNPLCLLVPLSLLGFYLCFLMPRSGLTDLLAQEE